MTLEELSKEIRGILKQLDDQANKYNCELLLSLASNLVTYNFDLGRHYVRLYQEVSLQEAGYKRAIDSAFMNFRFKKLSIEEAKAKAREEHQETEVKLITMQAKLKELSLLRKDLQDKVSVIQSYCSLIKDQLKNSNL